MYKEHNTKMPSHAKSLFYESFIVDQCVYKMSSEEESNTNFSGNFRYKARAIHLFQFYPGENFVYKKNLKFRKKNGEIVDNCLTLNTKIRVMTLNFLTVEKEETQCFKKYLGMTKEN